MRHPPEALKGLTPLLVLDALSSRELSGPEILRRIRDATQGGIEVAEGTIYPLLYRLEAQRRIRGRWREEAGKRRSRVYALTPAGTTMLSDMRAAWRALMGSLAHILPTEATA